ncbi:MAG: thiamine diphosphokinase [Spirochaetales bacterium]|nr:thiamine diphosphokinase [Spirochaetales bacterium]
MENRFGLILTGGLAPEYHFIEDLFSLKPFIVAADSGLDTAIHYGCDPDLVVGDMDSLANLASLKRVDSSKVFRYPVDKDETDTELAVRLMHERGILNYVLIGGGGGRMDHLFGLLALFDRENRPREWVTHDARMIAVDSSMEFSGFLGATVSFFPIGRETCRMESSGLKWNLDGLIWKRGDVGISNKVISEPFSVEIKTGALLLVHHYGENTGDGGMNARE